MIQVKEFPISGLQLITLRSFEDERGLFTERFKTSDFEALHLPIHFVQDNYSRSNPGVLRGLHYQWAPAQGKLVTCLRGRVFDVAVDLRASSPTFGKHVSIELDGDRPQWFWIPAGFAHGFCVLGDQAADVFYKCNYEYNAQAESGIHWADPELAIQWPQLNFQMSPKDERQKSFRDYAENPAFR